MREVIFKDNNITLTAFEIVPRAVGLRRAVKVPSVTTELSMFAEELDALCEWWAKKRAKEAK